MEVRRRRCCGKCGQECCDYVCRSHRAGAVAACCVIRMVGGCGLSCSVATIADETDDSCRVETTVFELAGQDRAGITADVAHLLTQNGCNVRSAAVRRMPAPRHLNAHCWARLSIHARQQRTSVMVPVQPVTSRAFTCCAGMDIQESGGGGSECYA